jgi:hypothetical protein
LCEEDDVVGQTYSGSSRIRATRPRHESASQALKKTRSPAAWKSIRSGTRLGLLGSMYRYTVFSSLSPLERSWSPVLLSGVVRIGAASGE